jgi:hypothetical protein
MTPAIEANSRELRLARRALKTARTHLRNAANRVCMSEQTRNETNADALLLEDFIRATTRHEAEANAHLSAMRKRRAK